MKKERLESFNNLKNNFSEKTKIEIIKNNYLNKIIFCHLYQEFTYINKLYKSSNYLNSKILVKYYCSQSHQDHSFTLID